MGRGGWPAPRLNDSIHIINRGIGAQTTAQVLGRFDAHVRPLHPNVIVLQVCINDLKTVPLFSEQKASIISRCKQNIQRIVDQSLELRTTVVLTTIFPLGEIPLERRLFWSDDVAIAIDAVNAECCPHACVDSFDAINVNHILMSGSKNAEHFIGADRADCRAVSLGDRR